MWKQKYKIKCVSCGKPVFSVDKSRQRCNECLSWTKPGIGQIDIFNNVTK